MTLKNAVAVFLKMIFRVFSFSYQISTVLKCNHQRLSDVCQDSNCAETMFTPREWLQLNDLVFILQPFYEAAVLIQAENSSTISLVVPTVLSLRRHLSNCSKRNLKCLKRLWMSFFDL